MRVNYEVAGKKHKIDLCPSCGAELYRQEVKQKHEPRRKVCSYCYGKQVRAKLRSDPDVPFDGLTTPSPEPKDENDDPPSARSSRGAQSPKSKRTRRARSR